MIETQIILVKSLALKQPLSERFHTGLYVFALREKYMIAYVFSFCQHCLVSANIILRNYLWELRRFQKISRIRTISLTRQSNRVRNIKKLLCVGGACKYRLSNFQFCDKTSKTPNINWIRVSFLEDYFRCSIIPWLKILINLIALIATSSKIHQLYPRLSPCLHHYILWLNIAVDNLLFL